MAPRKKPAPRPAPIPVPKKAKPAPKGTMYSDPLNSTSGVGGGRRPRSASSGVTGGVGGVPKQKARTGVSGATYTPKRGTRVTPNARPKGKR